MEKEQILQTLKQRLGQTSLSDRTLGDYVGNVMPEGDIEDSWYDKQVSILKSLSGQFSHDVATMVDDFKKNYNPTVPPTPKTEEPQVSDAIQQELDALKAKQKELDELLASQKKANESKALYDAVLGKANELKVANANIWKDSVKSVVIEDGMTEEQLLTKAKGVYENNLKRYVGEDAYPYNPNNAFGGNGDANKTIDDFFARKMAEGKFPTQK